MCTLNIEKEMRVSLNETASQRLQIYMNDIFTLLMLPLVCFFTILLIKTVRNEKAGSDESGIKHQKKQYNQSGFISDVSYIVILVWQTRTCWTDFKLTESNVLQQIHVTLFLDNDWYICRWEAATLNTNISSMPCRIDSFVEKHIANASYKLDKHKYMTKKYR